MDKQIPISEFKAHCYELLEEVQDQRHELVISKRGKAIARIIPIAPPTKLAGSLSSKCDIIGDIIEPIPVIWDAEKDGD